MGLWRTNINFRLPDALPPLPRRVQALAGIEVEAVRRRVDLQIGRIELELLAKSYGLTEAIRFINILDAGYFDKLDKDKEADRTSRMRGLWLAAVALKAAVGGGGVSGSKGDGARPMAGASGASGKHG